MSEILMIYDRPSPCILEDMLGVASGRHEPGPGGTRLRTSAWASLLRQRRLHGSLAAARLAAEERRQADVGTGGAGA